MKGDDNATKAFIQKALEYNLELQKIVREKKVSFTEAVKILRGGDAYGAGMSPCKQRVRE